MATAPESPCFVDSPPVAAEVARGVTRLFCRHDLFAICEVPLPNGRRADLMAIDGKGALTIVEIKVARADLVGDSKWTDYLDYCDRFFWAVPPALAAILDDQRYLPDGRTSSRASRAIRRAGGLRGSATAPSSRSAGFIRTASAPSPAAEPNPPRPQGGARRGPASQ